MLSQIKYVGSWARVKMNEKLGQRGAEMVEYAIVLACVVAVGIAIYGTKTSGNTLNGVLTKLWTSIKSDAELGTKH